MLITRVHAHNPGPYTGDGNNTYLLGSEEAVLIDAGTGDPQHLDDLAAALGRHHAELTRVVVTHGHSDHASGAPSLAARWPQARFFKMPWPEHDKRYEVNWQRLGEGDRLTIGEDVIAAIHTPGHAPDHVALWHEPTRTLFAGDLVTHQGTVVIPGSRGGSLKAYLSSLRRIMAMEPARLLPAHGPAIENPRGILERYLQHRAQRDEQILAAVRAGSATPEAIVGVVYDGLADSLRAAARESVLAHLIKMEEDGMVRREADEWRAV